MFHFPRQVVRAPWHKKDVGRGGGKKHPTFGPPTKQGGVLPGAEMEHPQELQSTPSDRVRKKGEKGAAPAASKQGAQGSVGGQREKGEEERKADRRQDALRRGLEVASTPDTAVPCSNTSGLIAGGGGNRAKRTTLGEGLGLLRGDSGVTLKARLGGSSY